MILVRVLPLLLLYGSAFSQQITPECMTAQMELNANQACAQAAMEFSQINMSVSLSVLETYCSPTCRDLTTTLANECVSYLIALIRTYAYCICNANQVHIAICTVDQYMLQPDLKLLASFKSSQAD